MSTSGGGPAPGSPPGVAALVALPAAAVLAGFLTWLPTDYPHFLAKDARPRLGLPSGPDPLRAAVTEAHEELLNVYDASGRIVGARSAGPRPRPRVSPWGR